jgi:hypothetical protein
MLKTLSEAGKEEVALALILLKDFKAQGRFEPAVLIPIIDLAKYLDVYPQFERLLSHVPPMRIEPREPADQGNEV